MSRKIFYLFKNIISALERKMTAMETALSDEIHTKLTVSALKLGYKDVSISLAANGYKWGSITVNPAQQYLICPVGYWIQGTSNTSCVVYAFYQENATTIQIAVRTWASSAHTVTARIYYLYL